MLDEQQGAPSEIAWNPLLKIHPLSPHAVMNWSRPLWLSKIVFCVCGGDIEAPQLGLNPLAPRLDGNGTFFFFFLNFTLFFLSLLFRAGTKNKNIELYKKYRGRSAVSVTTQAVGRRSSLNAPPDPFRIKDGGDAVRGAEITLPHCRTNERWFELFQNKVTPVFFSFF